MDGALQVGDRGREVSEFDFGDAATVERVGVIRPRGDGLVVTGAGAREIAVIEVQQPKLFVVAGRWIVEDGAFQFLDAPTAREELKRTRQQARVGDDFHEDVDERSDLLKEGKTNPKEVWTSADDVDD